LLSFVKIKGHAEEEKKPFHKLNRYKQLNVWCDRMAKSAQETLYIPNILHAPFYGEGLSIWATTTHKLYSNMGTHIRNRFHQHDAGRYVTSRHSLTREHFIAIDLVASEKAMAHLNPKASLGVKVCSTFLTHWYEYA